MTVPSLKAGSAGIEPVRERIDTGRLEELSRLITGTPHPKPG